MIEQTKKIIETERLYLREIRKDDFDELCKILQDKDVMYAYEHAFSDKEVWDWLYNQINRYKKYGFGLWAVILKNTNNMIGQCGLTMQNFNKKEVIEIGYLFQKSFWHKGYAIESAAACKDYAFKKLNAKEVFSIIRDTNDASKKVAEKNGMNICGKVIKHYYNIDMPHVVFSIKNKINPSIL